MRRPLWGESVLPSTLNSTLRLGTEIPDLIHGPRETTKLSPRTTTLDEVLVGEDSHLIRPAKFKGFHAC